MGIRKVEVLNDKYLRQKTEILDNLFVDRYDVKMSDIEVSNLNKIKIQSPDGESMSVNLTKYAINGLTDVLGISRKFVDTLRKGFGNEEDDNSALLDLIIKKIKGRKVSALTLVYNKRMKEVVNIYPAGTKLISDHQYFEALEKIILKTPGAYLRNITQASNGDLKAIVANPELEFQFGGMKDEVFTSGMSLDLDARRMQTSFFTERLVCTNGMSTQNKLTSKTVDCTEKVPEFLTAILDASYHIDSIHAFKQRINRCYHTRASLKEMLDVDSRLAKLLGNYHPILSGDMSVNEHRMVFGEDYLNDTHNHRFLKTDLTLWDLVNEITAVSSRIEQHRVAVSDGTNMGIQVIGGDLMFSMPDLMPGNIKQKYH